MPAYGYEFYLLVVNSISHSFAALTREISSWPREDKIHIHKRACNILYIFSRMTASNLFIRVSSHFLTRTSIRKYPCNRRFRYSAKKEQGVYITASLTVVSFVTVTWCALRPKLLLGRTLSWCESHGAQGARAHAQYSLKHLLGRLGGLLDLSGPREMSF